MKATIWLEYPMKELNPNIMIRRHWSVIQADKSTAHFIGKQRARVNGGDFHTDGHIQITFTFFPSTANVRDQDNALSSMKAYVDGIFNRLKMDDVQIERTIIEWGEKVKGGCVCVEMERLDDHVRRVCALTSEEVARLKDQM